VHYKHIEQSRLETCLNVHVYVAYLVYQESSKGCTGGNLFLGRQLSGYKIEEAKQ